jgi:hypothetical protein
MERPSRRCRCGSSRGARRLLPALVPTFVLLTGCATTPPAPTATPEAIPSHVYARPLDDVLLETTTLLANNGWKVQRSGNTLVTEWRSGGEASAITYRVYGQRVDAAYCSVRIERVLATRTVVWTEPRLSGHSPGPGAPNPVAASREMYNPYDVPPAEFEEDTPNDKAGGTAVPYGLVISHIGRDKALELALEQRLEPPSNPEARPTEGPVLAEAPADLGSAPPPSLPGALAPVPPAAVPPNALPTARAAAPSPGAARPLKSLAGIWEGTFSFRGNVSGSYVGEVAVAVEGDSAEVSDFCPERGGTLTATGTGEAAAWQGHLVCPPIRLKECAAAALNYDFATATLEGGTLRVVATGTVDTPAGCGETSGPISVTFIAQKADYAHIAVSKTKGHTTCVWPSDWEDLASIGSMSMPEMSPEASAYLGIIRVKGSRLADIQRLLRHCHHLVLLHGEPVSMKLAVTHAP